MKNWSRIKPKVNLIIDTIMFIDLMAVAGLGFLMKYVLLPGYKINEMYDRNTELYFWGLDRHQWGTVHLCLALSMVFLLIFHIILHWGTIVNIFRQIIPGKKNRLVISLFIGALGIFFAIGPLYIKPEIALLQRKYNRNRIPDRYSTNPDTVLIKTNYDNVGSHYDSPVQQKKNLPGESSVQSQDIIEEVTADSDRHHYNQVNIDGTMTLSEISVRYNLSVEELAGVINVPSAYANERLGRLKKRYGFEMDDLRVFVTSKSRNNGK